MIAATLAAPAAAIETVAAWQHTGALNTPCAGSQCIITFPVVPAGQRLVVTEVMAQLGPATDTIVLEGGSATGFIPKNNPGTGYVAQPITLYYEAGSAPRARMFVPNATATTSLIVTLVGHLVPAH